MKRIENNIIITIKTKFPMIVFDFNPLWLEHTLKMNIIISHYIKQMRFIDKHDRIVFMCRINTFTLIIIILDKPLLIFSECCVFIKYRNT